MTYLTSIQPCICHLIFKWHHWKRQEQMWYETEIYLRPHAATVRQGSIGGLSPRGLCVQTATHKTLWSPTLPSIAGCLPVLWHSNQPVPRAVRVRVEGTEASTWMPAAAWLWAACRVQGAYTECFGNIFNSHSCYTIEVTVKEGGMVIWGKIWPYGSNWAAIIAYSMRRHSHKRSNGNESLLYQLLYAPHLFLLYILHTA